ncbi:hypothetical protein WJX81_000929 [Elliptochloris bilobata]|uniref:Uncharacterized protein n=1 Tax=Elliptochloris bilobata TaxID=381761 RepID=A0AAW1S1V7_9CHLO
MAPFIGGLEEKPSPKPKVLKAEDQKDQNKAVQTFMVPPERYIRTPSDELLEEATVTVKAKMGPDAAKTLEQIARLADCSSQYEFMSLRRQVKRDFLIFSLAAQNKTAPQRVGKPALTEAELDKREDACLDAFHRLLTAAHFRLLSPEDWATAQADAFTFTSPVDVRWEAMDPELLRRFWTRHAADRATAADISERVLVFHRGISNVRAQGLYINEKLDLLIQYLIVDPFQALYSRVFKRKARLPLGITMEGGASDQGYTTAGGPAPDNQGYAVSSPDPTKPPGAAPASAVPAPGAVAAGLPEDLTDWPHKPAEPGAATAAPPAAPAAAGATKSAATEVRAPRKPAAPASGGNGADEGGAGGAGSSTGHHTPDQVVQRTTLKQLMPDAAAVFRNLTSSVELREPAFRSVVVIYRRKGSAPGASDHGPMQELDPRLARRNIVVKRFDEIPMADIEMVFPDKRFYFKPLLLIQLSITILGGVIAAISSMVGKLSMGTVMTVVTLLAGRASQMYFTMNLARQQVVDQVTKALYEQTMDAQEGVTDWLLDQMAAQHVKELLLAYYLLLLADKPLTEAQLDEAIEAHLAAKFGEKLDFALEAAVPTLLQDGLFSRDGKGHLVAAPLEEAHAALLRKWRATDGSDLSACLPRGPRKTPATKQVPQGEKNTGKEAAATLGHEHGGLHLRDRLRGLFGSSSKKEE